MPKAILKQFGQIFSGVRSLFSWSFVETLTPDWILRLTVEAIPKAFWGKTPEDQIEGSLILIGWSIITSLFTGFVTAFFVLFFAFFLFIGILRFSDAGSGAWDSITSFWSMLLPGVGSDGSYGRRRGR